MTPKEKAIELINYFSSKTFCTIESDFSSTVQIGTMTTNSAKECAKKICDEMLKFNINAKSEPQFVIERKIDEYWNEVKNILNNF